MTAAVDRVYRPRGRISRCQGYDGSQDIAGTHDDVHDPRRSTVTTPPAIRQRWLVATARTDGIRCLKADSTSATKFLGDGNRATYDDVGNRLTQVKDAGATRYYRYDERDRLLCENERRPAHVSARRLRMCRNRD
jgi:YD repeat-containing protein